MGITLPGLRTTQTGPHNVPGPSDANAPELRGEEGRYAPTFVCRLSCAGGKFVSPVMPPLACLPHPLRVCMARNSGAQRAGWEGNVKTWAKPCPGLRDDSTQGWDKKEGSEVPTAASWPSGRMERYGPLFFLSPCFTQVTVPQSS